MSVRPEHVMLADLPRSAEVVLTLCRDGHGLRLLVELVTRAADRSGMSVAESRHTLTTKSGSSVQVLGDLQRFVTSNLAAAMMEVPG